MSIENLRNIAIVAHVDHGKTTLVDCLLKQSGTFSERTVTTERMMDSNDQEKERGITILSKNTAINWNGNRINIVDTPGHADFGGEVERVLSMVDSVLILVDAMDGPMPQTRFVTQKAFAMGFNPIVVINKIDRPGARPDWVIDQVFDLFDKLGATNEQLDFPIVYASALHGYASLDDSARDGDMTPLYEAIMKHVPAPKVDLDGPFQMRVSQLDYNNFYFINYNNNKLIHKFINKYIHNHNHITNRVSYNIFNNSYINNELINSYINIINYNTNRITNTQTLALPR